MIEKIFNHEGNKTVTYIKYQIWVKRNTEPSTRNEHFATSESKDLAKT